MGKIQSAITGAILTSIGVATASSMTKEKGSQEQKDRNEAESQQAQDYQTNAKTTESVDNNLTTRRKEANGISKKYVDSKTKQKEDFNKLVEKVKEKAQAKGGN